MTFERVFIAGTMQGASKGAEIRDQGYRELIGASLEEACPGIEIVDPHVLMQEHVVTSGMALATEFIELAQNAEFRSATASAEIAQLRERFRQITAIAGECDLCVAYLPDHVPSMGTAMEMYAAYLSGATIVSITGMVQNLSILSLSTAIVPDIESFTSWLKEAQSF